MKILYDNIVRIALASGLNCLLLASTALGHDDSNQAHYDNGFNDGYWTACAHAGGIRNVASGTCVRHGSTGGTTNWQFVCADGTVPRTLFVEPPRTDFQSMYSTGIPVLAGTHYDFLTNREWLNALIEDTQLGWDNSSVGVLQMDTFDVPAIAMAKDGLKPGSIDFTPMAGVGFGARFIPNETGATVGWNDIIRTLSSSGQDDLAAMLRSGVEGGLYVRCER